MRIILLDGKNLWAALALIKRVGNRLSKTMWQILWITYISIERIYLANIVWYFQREQICFKIPTVARIIKKPSNLHNIYHQYFQCKIPQLEHLSKHKLILMIPQGVILGRISLGRYFKSDAVLRRVVPQTLHFLFSGNIGNRTQTYRLVVTIF